MLSWYDDKSDKELYKITPILEFLAGVNDVRKYLPKMVVSNEISYQKASEIINAYNILQKNQSNNQKTKNELNQDLGNTKEINIRIVNNNMSNYIINNNDISESKTTKNINAFRSSNYSQNNFYNGNPSESIKGQNKKTAKSIKQLNDNLNGLSTINVGSSVNINSPLNFCIKSIEKVKPSKQMKYSNNNNQFNKKTINNKNRPLTSSVIHHIRELSLKEREKTKLAKPILYKSPSSQAIILSSSTTTPQQKTIKFSLNKGNSKNSNIHPISLYSNKNWVSSRPKSTGKTDNFNLCFMIPKTPKIQDNKKNTTNSFSPLDDVFMKRRLSNTSRHIDHKKINYEVNTNLSKQEKYKSNLRRKIPNK